VQRDQSWRSISDSVPDPGRISATVENRANPNDITFHAIVNCERKALTQAALVSENFGMNTSVGCQCVHILQKRVSKIVSQASYFAFVKTTAGDQILPRFRQDLDSHEVRRRISALAFSQSRNFDFPDSISCSRSRSSFSCQAGDSIASGFEDKLCQSVSIVWSFSATLSFGMAVRISSTVLIPKA